MLNGMGRLKQFFSVSHRLKYPAGGCQLKAISPTPRPLPNLLPARVARPRQIFSIAHPSCSSINLLTWEGDGAAQATVPIADDAPAAR